MSYANIPLDPNCLPIEGMPAPVLSLRIESDSGVTNAYGNPIYFTSEQLIYEADTFTPEQQITVTDKGGNLFATNEEVIAFLQNGFPTPQAQPEL